MINPADKVHAQQMDRADEIEDLYFKYAEEIENAVSDQAEDFATDMVNLITISDQEVKDLLVKNIAIELRRLVF